MNRESVTYFEELPEAHIPRSKIMKDHSYKTTWNVGDIIPIYLDHADPGTTIEMKMNSVMRMQTPLFPTMDPLFTDIIFFAIPYRLVWSHWEQFWGESPEPWYPEVEYEIPQLYTERQQSTENGGFQEGSIADYMGFPTKVEGISVSALPFRAYVKVWNDWWRSTPLQSEAEFTMGDEDAAYNPNLAVYGGKPLKANKMHDLFTSALPSPMRGPEVTLPLGNYAPVIPRNIKTDSLLGTTPMTWKAEVPGAVDAKGYWLYGEREATGNNFETKIYKGNQPAADNNRTLAQPNNLWADLSNATAATITALRSALAVAHFYEQSAKYGGRYTEILRGIFNVQSPDARLQRSEYLGGVRITHNMTSVVQTSSTDETSPQGNVAAYSHTVRNGDKLFTKSFTEHTIILGVMVTRYKHSYSQGIPAMWSKKKLWDFYLPQFNGVSEVPVKVKEIYATGTSADEEVFGYQEYGYPERYGVGDIVTSEMRPNADQTLDAWHYGDDYDSQPILGEEWIKENAENVDRTLAVSSRVSNQLFGVFYFYPTYVLPMPIYSMPGLDKI